MKTFIQPFARFFRDERGTVLIETVVMLPMLLWTCFGLFVFWDAHKAINNVQKATYTVADTISRRMLPINTTYIDGLRNVMDFLMIGNQQTLMRVSSVTWSQNNNRFEVLWSYSPANAMPPYTTDSIQTQVNKIPTMADGDTVVIVETNVDYTPGFDVGLNDLVISQFVVTRPRLAPRIEFQ